MMPSHKGIRNYRLNSWLKSGQDLLRLVYPSVCIVCQNELSSAEKNCCGFCIENLPFTYFELLDEASTLDKLFWGRAKIESTFALVYFEKGKGSQQILHHLKYKHNYQLGVQFGEILGQKILSTAILKGVDFLLPVPVHGRKEFQRGYNQSEALAEGISKQTGIPLLKNYASKKIHTGSQTKKGRFLRWDNVSENFRIDINTVQSPQHIAIIDDVITTGATIEALIRTIHENNPEIRISVISLALTK